MAYLLVVTGKNEGDFHPLPRQSVTIGRSETCTIQIVDDDVSREHIKVRYDRAGHTYHATDNLSANGVLINGSQIDDEIQLANGDMIKIGSSELIFSERDDTDRDNAIEHHRRSTQEEIVVTRIVE